MIPCCLCHLNFTVAVPEEELIQVRGWRPSGICEVPLAQSHSYTCLSLFQVAVTAVAMTFDKEQTQEKPTDKSVNKGLSDSGR